MALTCTMLLALASAAPAARAQGFGIGGHIGYDVTFENAFAGAQARIGLPGFPLVFQPGIEIPIGGDAEYLWAEGNLLYMVGANYTSTFTPYFGAGLAAEFADDDGDQSTTLGANLIGGLQFGFGPGLAPFIQARYTVDLSGAERGEETEDPLGVSVGAIFRFGGQ